MEGALTAGERPAARPRDRGLVSGSAAGELSERKVLMTHMPAVTSQIAEFAVTADGSTLPDEALHLAERAVTDTIGVILAATHDRTVEAIQAAHRGRLCPGPASVLAMGQRTQAVQAALLNGTAAHALDFDDVADGIKGHPSTVLVPAILAVAQEVQASGRDVLEAYCVGFQIESAIADGMAIDRHYARGWHSTATIGVLAAAAAACRLLGFDVTRTRQALGIAASMAGGSRQNFGTMTKPLHAGMAASDGVLAATLASAGFTADTAQLESPLGYFALYGDENNDLSRVATTLSEPWSIVTRGLNVKKFPCCYNTHRAADAVLSLTGEGLRAEDVASAQVTLEPAGLGPLIHHRPRTGLQGKFSLEYVTAAALLDGKLTLRTFTDEEVQRSEAQDLLARVSVAESDTPPAGDASWQHAYAAIKVRTRGGKQLECRVDIPRGHAALPLTEEELTAKFTDCVAFSGTGYDAAALLDLFLHLRKEPAVTDLVPAQGQSRSA